MKNIINSIDWRSLFKFGFYFDLLISVSLLIPGIGFVVLVFFLGIPMGLLPICSRTVGGLEPTTFGNNFVTYCAPFIEPTTIGLILVFVFWFIVGVIVRLVFNILKAMISHLRK